MRSIRSGSTGSGSARQIPDTADLVPVFPWFGVMLLGVLGMRMLRDRPMVTWRSDNVAVRGLGLLGRWSLLFYLLHQSCCSASSCLPRTCSTPPRRPRSPDSPGAARRSACRGTMTAFCTAYCGCALDVTVRDNLWGAINAVPRTADQQHQVDSMTTLCTAMSR